ncbi:DEKNAAC101311 [Brettanomyces naardenensis]|uniref:DEKNAAC101311 n=1 Tax=Brettanomyces naardenensis TaxID=13370 RepID=A0A448YHP3_BRENA|nr:DEKNAAC101311 [Brettanomyces naardenensis]
MDFIKDIANKAQRILDNTNSPKKLTKDELLRREFRLPDTESIVDESLVELTISTSYLRARIDRLRKTGIFVEGPATFNGKLTLLDNFVVFKDSYNSMACSFVIELPMVQRIQRIRRAYDFAISLLTTNGLEVTIKFIGIKSQCELFGQRLIKLLKQRLPEVDAMTNFRMGLYSEYLLSKNGCNTLLVKGPPTGGLGWVFKFPGNALKLNDRLKMKKWFDYFRENGRNFAMVHSVPFYKLVSYGLPNKLRGELWETCCGSIYLRYMHEDEYLRILVDHDGEKSFAIEEIEKDLNRSLPEYPAYQNPEGINRLRRVLTAYSWKNPEVGYCQAMNIVTAALLIYMSEEQVFWCLSVLVDKIIPGYYSKTMYGVLLDQKVFEALVLKTLPVISEHFAKHDIQLSIVSLPWFLSFFLSTMPLIHAFRVVDMMLLHGPKVLFQVAMAVIRVNGDELLKCEDDGECISIFKEYFSSLDETEESLFHRDRMRTKFDNLWEVAFREFSIIDDKIILQLRKKFENEVFQGIETFVKRAELRNLPKTHNLNTEQLSNIYDRYYNVLMGGQESPPDRSACNMDFVSFENFMSQLVSWIDAADRTAKQTEFLKRLYRQWSSADGEMSLESLVIGLDKIIDRDIMNSLSNFISLYDDEGTGRIGKETVIQLAEDLILITTPWREGRIFDDITNQNIEAEIAKKIIQRREVLKEQGVDITDDDIKLPDEVRFNEEKWQGRQAERYLTSSSNFLKMIFQYAQPAEDPDKPLISLSDDEDDEKKDKQENSIKHNAALDPSRPVYITPSTFRMVILADETYESFFRTEFWKSFRVNEKISEKLGVVDNLRGMFTHFLADGRRVAVQVRKRMDEATKNAKPISDTGSTENRPRAASSNTSIGSKSTRSRASSSLNDDDDDDDDDFGNFVGADYDELNDIPTGGNELSVLHDAKEMEKESELVRGFESAKLE